jgi:hypothetical protein
LQEALANHKQNLKKTGEIGDDLHVAIYYLPAACKMSVDFIMSSCKGLVNLPLVRIACGIRDLH